MLAVAGGQKEVSKREEEVSTGKVVANAGSHRILDALADGPKHLLELKLIVGAINSRSRFQSEYMGRMLENGYVRQDKEGMWHLTKSGRKKYDEIGPVARIVRPEVAGPRLANNGLEVRHTLVEKPQPMRAGAMDFAKLPSRIGNKLYYPDGRIEEINHGS